MCLAGGGVASPLSRPRQGGCDGCEVFHRTRRHAAQAGRTALAGTAVNPAARSGARTHPSAPLQPAHRRSLCALDTRLRAVPRGASPGADGWAGGRGVSGLAGIRTLRVRIHAPTGAVSADLSLCQGAADRLALAERRGAATRAAAPAGGVDEGRGGAHLRCADGRALALRSVALRHGHAHCRRAATAREGHRFLAPRGDRARGKRRQGPCADAPAEPGAWLARSARARMGCGHAIRPMRQVVWKCPTHWPANTTRSTRTCSRSVAARYAVRWTRCRRDARAAAGRLPAFDTLGTGRARRQPARLPGPQSFDTSSTSLPKFSPENSLPSASGKFSRPATMSSRLFMRPSFR